MLAEYMNKSILFNNNLNESIVDGDTNANVAADQAELNNPSPDETEVNIYSLENKLDSDKDDIADPMVESAIDICRKADEVYLITENTIAKMRFKASQYKVILEDASSTDAEKKEAVAGTKKLDLGAAKALFTTVIEKLSQLANKFKEAMIKLINNLTVFGLKISKWGNTTGKANIKTVSENGNASLSGFKYKSHTWKMTKDDISIPIDKLKLAINNLMPDFSTNDIGYALSHMKEVLEYVSGFSNEDVKRKIIKEMYGSKFKDGALSIDNLEKILIGNEQDHTGITVFELNNIVDDVTAVTTTIVPVIKLTQNNAIKMLDDVRVNCSKKANDLNSGSNKSSDEAQFIAKYMAKKASIISIAVSLVNMIAVCEIACARHMAFEGIRIVNTATAYSSRYGRNPNKKYSQNKK